MQVKWHRLARQDLRQIRAYIAGDNPSAAAHMAQRILLAIDQLSTNPGIGRPGRVLDTRELVIAGTPYVAPYRVVGDTVVVLRVLHGAQRWPLT